MVDVVYRAGSDLRNPTRFLRAAAADLVTAGPIGWRLFQRHARTRYRRAWLGYLWLVLPAAASALLCTLVRSQRLVTVGPTVLPYPVYVLSGVIFWQLFVEALTAPLQHLNEARPMITRSGLPAEGVFMAALIALLLTAAVRLAVLAAALLLFGVELSAWALLVPLGAVSLILLGFAIGLLVAPVGMLYDDVSQAITLGTGFILFVTPVLYPIPYRGAFRLNPVTPLLDSSRGWLIGAAASPGLFPVVVGSALAVVAGWLIFRAARPHVVERLC
jgi:lipopolysaccharide transport system permease protein